MNFYTTVQTLFFSNGLDKLLKRWTARTPSKVLKLKVKRYSKVNFDDAHHFIGFISTPADLVTV